MKIANRKKFWNKALISSDLTDEILPEIPSLLNGLFNFISPVRFTVNIAVGEMFGRSENSKSNHQRTILLLLIYFPIRFVRF